MFPALRWLLRTLPLGVFLADAQAQLNDPFDDASLQAPVVWHDTTSWIQEHGVLRSNDLREQQSFAIYTSAPPLQAGADWEWQLSVRLAFNPSSANYLDWFLAADSSPLHARNGFYVRLGNTRDEISLYRLQNGIATEMISGRDGRLNQSDNTWLLRVRLFRGERWSLEVSAGQDQPWQPEGTCAHGGTALPTFFGFRIRQSTAAFHQRHFIDWVYAGPARYDTMPPVLTEAVFLADGRLRLRFSEPLAGLEDPGTEHYWLEGAGGPDSIQTDPDPTCRMLRWKDWQPEVRSWNLYAGGISDTAGNRSSDFLYNFFGGIPDIPRRGNLLITEIMAAPESAQPEWVELQNVHSRWLRLGGCSFSDAGSTILLPDSWLAPGERCILQPASWTGRVGEGKSLLVPLPGLNNSGDTLTLRNPQGTTLHRVGYSDAWYGNPVLAAGGYSLELIDTTVWCGGGENWTGSTSLLRATPGRRNSAAGVLQDTVPPKLLEVYPESETVLRLRFSEWPDSASLNRYAFVVQPSHSVPESLVLQEEKLELRLHFASSFIAGRNYTLYAAGMADCSGNAMSQTRSCFGLPADTLMPGMVLVNEVLFDPETDGVDFIELYNPGPVPVDLKPLELLRLDPEGVPLEAAPVAPAGRILMPGAFLVLTENPDIVRQQYPCTGGDSAYRQLKPMPALLAGGGQVAIRHRNGSEIDRVAFHPGMHHPLLRRTKGFSLERIRPQSPGLDPANWHSAAEDCRGATPGRRNSQTRAETPLLAGLALDAEWFTPDNDGHADQAALQYRFDRPGMLLTLRVYDEWGAPVRVLCLHRLCGLQGRVMWDGMREDGRTSPAGNYILLAEVQDAAGRQQAARFVLSLLRAH